MPARRRGAEAIEQNLRRAAGLVVLTRNPQQVWRAHRIHAAEAAFDAGQHLEIVRKDLALVEATVVVRILEDEDPVLQLQIETLIGVGIGVILRNPQPPLLVPAHRNGLLHVRFMRKNGRLEAGRQAHQLNRLVRGRERDGLRLVVVGRGEIRKQPRDERNARGEKQRKDQSLHCDKKQQVLRAALALHR